MRYAFILMLLCASQAKGQYRMDYHLYPYNYGYGSRQPSVNNYYYYYNSFNTNTNSNSFNTNTNITVTRLTVEVPGNGRVWINGVETTSASSADGKFTVKAEWDSKVAHRQVTVISGQQSRIFILAP